MHARTLCRLVQPGAYSHKVRARQEFSFCPFCWSTYGVVLLSLLQCSSKMPRLCIRSLSTRHGLSTEQLDTTQAIDSSLHFQGTPGTSRYCTLHAALCVRNYEDLSLRVFMFAPCHVVNQRLLTFYRCLTFSLCLSWADMHLPFWPCATCRHPGSGLVDNVVVVVVVVVVVFVANNQPVAPYL